MEYQINVSLHGLFMFRTDWDSDKSRVNETYRTIKKGNKDIRLDLYSRKVVMHNISIDDL
jgi:hypothetical protein